MAEALVSLVLDQLDSVMRQELEQEVRLVVGVQVKDLTTTLTMLQPFLRDAEVKQFDDKAVEIWLQELKQIAYDADDVLDEWRTTILLSQQFNQSWVTTTLRIIKKISCCFFSPCSCFKPVVLRHEIGHKINDIKERLDAIGRDKALLNLERLDADAIGRTRAQLNLDASRTQQVLPRRATSSSVNVAEISGLDDDKKIIVDWLLGESSRQEIHMPVPILSIIGMGGSGKTTLAQLVFQQEKTSFDLSIWVCVSYTFDREKVAKEIIEQATGNKPGDFVGWEALHLQLSDSIKGKQFLIVLDDVWSENPNDWAPLKLSLDGGAPGSRIIVTTRNQGVANMMGSRIHMLALLSSRDCWLLFQQIAFVGRSQTERETLEEIGMQIAEKCKDVPLAAKMTASLMRYKQTNIEWRNVLESDIWKLQQWQTDFLPSLLLSYHDLPSNLKQCFLYCAIFPGDEIIKKDMLVKLWMAQGFLGLDGDQELEIIGGNYFDDLAMRSFFQDLKEDDKGKIIECKMHDLVLDFAQHFTKNEFAILDKYDTLLNSEKLRHINAGDIDIESLSDFKVKKIRSLILGRSKPILSELFCQVACLRTLDLSFSSLEKLPDEVDRLLHLRYLDLSNTKLTELPETTCNLYNLQTLKLNWCDDLCKLPEGIGRLLNLRHLEVQYASHLSYFPQGFGKLKHLRTLHKFVVSNARGGCKLEELKDLNLISGELKITMLRQVENIDEAKRAELQRKENIVFLTMSFVGESEQMITSENENMEKRMEEIMEGLQPHSNLEELLIHDYPGLAFPSWMSVMSNIVKLVLEKCQNCTQLPALGKLPSLVTLKIDGCHSIKQVGVEFLGISESGIQQPTTFPKLRELTLASFKEWEEWNLSLSLFAQNEILPSLSLLEISDCPKLKALPATISKLPSLDRLELEGMGGRADILGICGFANGESMPLSSSSASTSVPLFPKLTSLILDSIDEWEEEIYETTASSISIMPRLRDLTILFCKKLEVIPNYLFSHNLMKLKIRDCPRLIGMPPFNLPSLESLKFGEDVGIFSRSLTPSIISNINHNLKSFELYFSPHSSLPQGLNYFKSLQELNIHFCRSMDFNPEEELSWEHFPNLRRLRITFCGIMTERCSRVDWNNLSHISEILVDHTWIRANSLYVNNPWRVNWSDKKTKEHLQERVQAIHELD